jgi:hypothetical protein
MPDIPDDDKIIMTFGATTLCDDFLAPYDLVLGTVHYYSFFGQPLSTTKDLF